MDNEIYRKKSLDEIKSPDKLEDYIKVTNLNLWVLLAAIVVILFGGCLWGAIGTIESKVSVSTAVVDGEAICQSSAELFNMVKDRLLNGDEIIFEMNDIEGRITDCYYDEKECFLYGEIDVEDCIGTAYVHETINPISLLFE